MRAKAKILVIEDEPDFRSILQHILSQEGYDVVTASNGEKGLQLFAGEAPDLVLLDGHLPDMDGFDVCRRIRSNGPRPRTPVIMCTVRSEVAPVADGLASGATDYVIKPFEVKDLISRVAAVLGKRGR